MPTPQTPLPITGHERHSVGVDVWDSGTDDRGSLECEVTAPMLLPAEHERPGGGIVENRGARGRETEPTEGALGTAPNGPRTG
jgi:hypothetical protein